MRNVPPIASTSALKRISSSDEKIGEEALLGFSVDVPGIAPARSESPGPMDRYSVRSRRAIAAGPLPPAKVTSVPDGRPSSRLLRTPVRLTKDSRPEFGLMLVSVTRKLPRGVRLILTGVCSPVIKVCGWHHAGDARNRKGISDFIDMR